MNEKYQTNGALLVGPVVPFGGIIRIMRKIPMSINNEGVTAESASADAAKNFTNDLDAEKEGTLAFRKLTDGRYIAVIPLTFGRARLVIGRGMSFENSW